MSTALRVTTHAIAWSVGFWTAVALQFAYDHAINAPTIIIRRNRP